MSTTSTEKTPISQVETKRIGLLTFHFVQNFGGLWQAYALAETIRRLGCEVEIIDYVPPHVENGSAYRFSISRQSIISNLTTAYQKIQTTRLRLFNDRKQQKQFSQFQREYLPIGKTRFTRSEQMTPSTLDYHAIICGSDQIWNPSKQHGADPAYFLDVDAGHAILASYSASFGCGGLDYSHDDRVKRWLEKLQGVSVRESSGLKVLNRLQIAGAVHLDPTLLIDDYATRFNFPNQSEQDHIAVYTLRSKAGINGFAEQLSSEWNAKLVFMKSAKRTLFQSRRTIYPGPIQWLSTIATSRAVITNSFHGTAMSIIHRKPFLTFSIGGRKSSLDDRSRDLLERLGLTNRFVQNPESQDLLKKMNEPIDWARTITARDKLSEESELYLRRIIGLPSAGVVKC